MKSWIMAAAMVFLPLTAQATESASVATSDTIGSFALGFSNYTPGLDHVRKLLQESGGGKLVARSRWSRYISFSLRHGDTGERLDYFYYKAEAEAGDYALTIHNLGVSELGYLTPPTAIIGIYMGVGGNIFYLRRIGMPELRNIDTRRNDFLWGINCLLGFELALQ